MTNHVTVSPALRRAVWQRRAEGVRQYQLARDCGLHPTVFSAVVNGIRPVEPSDPRVLAIAQVVGVAAIDAFAVVRRPSRPSTDPGLVR